MTQRHAVTTDNDTCGVPLAFVYGGRPFVIEHQNTNGREATYLCLGLFSDHGHVFVGQLPAPL